MFWLKNNCVFLALTNALFELSQNPDVQEKLSHDLEEKLSRLDDPSSDEYFDAVMNEMPYLEAVVKEILRKYPPVSQMSRVCSKDGYKLGNVTLYKGDIIFIPTR